MDHLYVFINDSFLFIEGYRHVKNALGLPSAKKPYTDYVALRRFIERSGELKRLVLVGADLPGTLISRCQMAGFEVQTFPKYPDFKTGRRKEKGIDQKVCWEVAKTIFSSEDRVGNKKIILCTGDRDLMTVLPDIRISNWAFELWLWKNSFSDHYVQQVEVFGTVRVLDREWKKFIRLGDAKPKRTPASPT